MNRARINEIVAKYQFPKFKENQLKTAIFKQSVADFTDISTLSKHERSVLNSEELLTVEPFKVLVSREKNAYKALLKLKSSGKLIETVLLNPKPDLWSTCISSQVGCAMNCSFCATGKMGLLQNLTDEEITDQVLFWKQYIQKEQLTDKITHKPVQLSHVVYMGMGEPMANLDAVFTSVAELIARDSFNLASRNISISTSGLIPGIKKLATQFPQVNLALSLHAANNELRSRLMPVNNAFPLEKLAKAIQEYLKTTNRKLFIEYILLDHENDSDENAYELIEWIKQLQAPHLVHVNLIVYNKTSSGHEESVRAQKFKQIIAESKIPVTIRKNLGRDIMAACGQLVTEQGGK